MTYDFFSKTKIFAAAVLALAVCLVVAFFALENGKVSQQNSLQFNRLGQNDLQNQYRNMVQSNNSLLMPEKQAVDPLAGALSRTTKKPFGIFITPKTSPVQPERFQGYHTGVDLEINPEELDADVAVKALCSGKLLLAKIAGGYGGVAVQSCMLDGQDVTVVYGHIRLSSVVAKVGMEIKKGDFVAYLGNAYGGETDGERKHLHLAIHKGNDVNILGYVQSKNDLDDWIDPAKYLD